MTCEHAPSRSSWNQYTISCDGENCGETVIVKAIKPSRARKDAERNHAYRRNGEDDLCPACRQDEEMEPEKVEFNCPHCGGTLEVVK